MGTGINKIKTLLIEADAAPPQFEFGDFYTIIFQRKGKKTETVVKILQAIKEEPKITRERLSELTGLSIRGVEWNLAKLKNEGKIKRIDPDKGGYWEIIDIP